MAEHLPGDLVFFINYNNTGRIYQPSIYLSTRKASYISYKTIFCCSLSQIIQNCHSSRVLSYDDYITEVKNAK